MEVTVPEAAGQVDLVLGRHLYSGKVVRHHAAVQVHPLDHFRIWTRKMSRSDAQWLNSQLKITSSRV